MESSLKVCEFCEWSIQAESGFLKCLLNDEDGKGLYDYCDDFKKRTGEHVTR